MTNVLPDLAVTMNPGLHLLVEQGLYDLATPTGSSGRRRRTQTTAG